MRLLIIAALLCSCVNDKNSEYKKRDPRYWEMTEYLSKESAKIADSWFLETGTESETIKNITVVYPVSLYAEIFEKKPIKTLKQEYNYAFENIHGWLVISTEYHKKGFVAAFGRTLQMVTTKDTPTVIREIELLYSDYVTCINSDKQHCLKDLEESLIKFQYQ